MPKQNDKSKLTPEQLKLSAYLDYGRLIEYYDIGSFRLGIQSLTIKDLDEIQSFFKSKNINKEDQESIAPSIFGQKFLYSVDGKVLTEEEKIEILDSFPDTVNFSLFKKWQKLQQKVEVLERGLTNYTNTFDSRLKFKLCKLFNTTPNNPIIRDMDPVTQSWFYRNIIEDEKELLNEIYDKIEYMVGFLDPQSARSARRKRLMAQGEEIDDPNIAQSTDFDQVLLDELKQEFPDLDTSQIKTLDDYIKFVEENVGFEKEMHNAGGLSLEVPKYSDEDKENLIKSLEKQKGRPLTQTEKEITINRLDNGLSINLQQIVQEAIDLDAVNLTNTEEILKDFDLDD